MKKTKKHPIRKYLANATDKEQAQAVVRDTNPLVGPDDALPQIDYVTGVVAFLCGPESKFINGAIIPIDGGYNCN